MKINPFYPFTKELLDAFVAKGHSYFVRQTFYRDSPLFSEKIKGSFLISHYDSRTTAMDHYGAISYDKGRHLYDWNNPRDRERLMVAASGPEGYRIFSTVFKTDWEKPVATRIKDKLRMYIKKLGWNPHRDEGVTTNYELQFGELYLRIKYAGREAKVKFEEIENIF